MKTFIFISHAGEDKPRIRFITDGLIKAGYTLWLDRPNELGYSAKEISASFLRILPGLPWESEIQDALRHAGCVLFLASTKFLERHRKQWHDEVVFARIEGTLLTIKLEEVELPEDVSAIQWANLSCEINEIRGSPDKMRDWLELLMEAIEHKLGSRRATRFGAFAPSSSKPDGHPPAEEQLERFFMMMDREREIYALASSRAPVLFLKSGADARPSYVRRRLPEIELPSRQTTDAPNPMNPVAGADLRHLRAKLLCGERRADERVWRSVAVPWPIGHAGKIGDPRGEFVRTLLANSPRPLSAIALEDDAFSLTSYWEALKACRFNVFACSTIEDASHLRRDHLKLISAISALLAGAPLDRFRLLLTVSPGPSKFFANWLSGGSRWLERALDTAQPATVQLADVALPDLDEWIGLMALLVTKTETAIGDAVAAAFGGDRAGKRIPLATLEQRMWRETASWRMRNRRAPESQLIAAGVWADEQV